MTELQGAICFVPNESNGVHLLLLMSLFQHITVYASLNANNRINGVRVNRYEKSSVVTVLTSPRRFLISFSKISFAIDEITIPVSSDVDITVEHYPSSGKYLMLMLAPEYGFHSCRIKQNHKK